MQTGQVSVWVPILVGIIGLVGVIAGQLVNAWREDRRWRRELQREEIRWEREGNKEKAKLAHESMIDWRNRRLNAYGDYLEALDDLLTYIVLRSDTTPLDNKEDGWAEQYYVKCQRIRHIGQRVRLICGQQLRTTITDESWIIRGVSDKLRSSNDSSTSFDLEAATVRDPLLDLFDYRDNVMGYMRTELETCSRPEQ